MNAVAHTICFLHIFKLYSQVILYANILPGNKIELRKEYILLTLDQYSITVKSNEVIGY